jgi:hypothetical protein
MRHGTAPAATYVVLTLAFFVSVSVWQATDDGSVLGTSLMAKQAAQDDPVNVILNHVKADKRQQYETFLFEGLLPALRDNAKTDPLARRVLEHTRMLLPTEANADGTYTYIWLMDPWVEGGTYAYGAIIAAARGAEEARRYVEMEQDSRSAPQIRYRVRDSEEWATRVP